ncbi:consensus disorder prediction [Desulfoluna spongiiphila]|nr:consensus disorder prediction [Desulfoluna spongiiphila]
MITAQGTTHSGHILKETETDTELGSLQMKTVIPSRSYPPYQTSPGSRNDLGLDINRRCRPPFGTILKEPIHA